jgi:hypothetical protein
MALVRARSPAQPMAFGSARDPFDCAARRNARAAVRDLYRLVACLNGPSVHIPVLERAIAAAAMLLNAGRVRAADEVVAGLELPLVTQDGAALMKALGRRLGIPVPGLRVDGRPSPTPAVLFEQMARLHDHKRAMAQALQKLFVPNLSRVAPANLRFVPELHPRWPAGQSDGKSFEALSVRVRRPPNVRSPKMKTGDFTATPTADLVISYIDLSVNQQTHED